MQLPKNFEELIIQANDENLYNKLVKQLNKDFLLANIDLEFDEDILPTSLKFLLHETIFKLIQEKFAEYLNLLYIIDVPENEIKQLNGDNVLELSEQVTFLLLLRELKKVWYRNKYQK